MNNYLDNFVKPKTSVYKKKQPVKLIIESDSEDENKEILKPDKSKKFIIEETSIPSPQEVELPKKNKTRKMVVVKGKQQTKKHITKKKFLILSDSTTNK
jgi:hypothetical protein